MPHGPAGNSHHQQAKDAGDIDGKHHPRAEGRAATMEGRD
jgi:hypothetical protein